MRSVYAASLLVGMIALLGWLVAEARRGDRPSATSVRRAIAGLVAFGIAGLSASFAGLAAWVAVLLAVVSAGAMVAYSDRAVS